MHWKQWDTPPKYFRPNDRWECGRLRSGQPCPCGPDAQGRCRTTENPSAQDPRTSEALGPCKPRRALWWRRRRLARASGLLLAGILAIILWFGGDKEFLAPGELASPHAQILSYRTTENRCAACHELEATESVVAFLAKSWSGHANDRRQQSLKCLDCHQQALPNAKGFSPHDLPSTLLAQLTRTQATRSHFTSFAASLPKQDLSGNDLACSACHVEHQGRWHDLTALNNERCQSCHQNRFAGFTKGHPEFTDYPMHRDARIHFNHQSHSSKHFATKGIVFDCRSCHVDESQPSAVGPVGRSVSYEKACANCHDASLRGSFSDGILVVHLPSLDREKIEAAGLTLGAWPKEASLMTDGTLSPMLRWLLAGDVNGQELLSRLPADGRLSDLSTSDSAALQLQVDLAAAIRSLIEELAQGGQPAFQQRLAVSLKSTQNSTALQASAETRISTEPRISIENPVVAGELSFAKSSAIGDLKALSAGVSPDVFRTAWLNWFQPEPVGMAELSFPKSTVASTGFDSLNAPTTSQQDRDPLLDDPLQDRSQEETRDTKDPLADEAIDPLAEPPGTATFGNGNSQKSKVEMLADMSPQIHTPHGGWMVDPRRLAIVYIPIGHADPTLKAWLATANSQISSDTPSHFHEILKPKGMGACTECHPLEQRSSNSIADERLWHAVESDPALRPFTRFNHVPHLTLPQLSQCTSCHAAQDDGHFKPMQLQNCMDCHTKQGAGDHCSQCHNYHIKSLSENP